MTEDARAETNRRRRHPLRLLQQVGRRDGQDREADDNAAQGMPACRRAA